jgi:hypothetical protein
MNCFSPVLIRRLGTRRIEASLPPSVKSSLRRRTVLRAYRDGLCSWRSPSAAPAGGITLPRRSVTVTSRFRRASQLQGRAPIREERRSGRSSGERPGAGASAAVSSASQETNASATVAATGSRRRRQGGRPASTAPDASVAEATRARVEVQRSRAPRSHESEDEAGRAETGSGPAGSRATRTRIGSFEDQRGRRLYGRKSRPQGGRPAFSPCRGTTTARLMMGAAVEGGGWRRPSRARGG